MPRSEADERPLSGDSTARASDRFGPQGVTAWPKSTRRHVSLGARSLTVRFQKHLALRAPTDVYVARYLACAANGFQSSAARAAHAVAPRWGWW